MSTGKMACVVNIAAGQEHKTQFEVPEKSAEIHRRGREAGENRVILGVHFPSDVAEGRLSAAAAIAVMTQNPAFTADLADARKELRAALGYTN